MLPFFAQSTNAYSENSVNYPVLMAFAPSNAPIAENAQHDPHYP